jgi:hypothetical protein
MMGGGIGIAEVLVCLNWQLLVVLATLRKHVCHRRSVDSLVLDVCIVVVTGTHLHVHAVMCSTDLMWSGALLLSLVHICM